MKIALTRLTLIRTRQLDDLRNVVAGLQDKAAELEEQLAEAREAAKDVGKARQPPEPPSGRDNSRAIGTPKVVRELIRVTDGLVDLIEGGAAQDPEHAAMALQWIRGRAEVLLASCDVVRIDDSGPVDLLRQEVVDSRPAPAGDLVDQIADTVRPGYSWHGSLIRPQQVVAYIPAEEMRGR